MRSKYINSTPGRKYRTENGFSDIDFLYDVKILIFVTFSLKIQSEALQ